MVIAIIALLASVVFASLSSARRKSRDARRVADIASLRTALELYFDGQGNVYPPATGTCDATHENGLELLVSNRYIPGIPLDPDSTATALKCYLYGTPAAPTKVYHLGATLEDAGNVALKSDVDCDSTKAAGCYAAADAKGGFIGTDPIYDTTP